MRGAVPLQRQLDTGAPARRRLWPVGAACAPTAPPVLGIERLTHRYGAEPVVSEVALTVSPGEIVCLVGPSGCGKTTTLRLVAGLEVVQSGRVMIGGDPVADAGRHVPPEARRIGLMFQDYALFPHMSVLDNVAFGIRRAGRDERRARAMEALAEVGLASYAAAYPHILSGGQQQRVALARALAPRPRLILLDEPFSGLDRRLRDRVRDDTMHMLKQSGAATLLVTHDPEEAMFMADRIAVMRAGRIEQLGTPDEIYCRPASAFVAEFFSEVNRLPGLVERGRVATPFGEVAAEELADGTAVEVLIRPEAIRLAPGPAGGRARARVMASRMLGRASLVHLSFAGEQGEIHLHARMPGRFLPREGEILGVWLDGEQAFVFPSTNPI